MSASMTAEELRRVRDTAQREAWPYNDVRANYEAAETYRRTQAEGRSAGLAGPCDGPAAPDTLRTQNGPSAGAMAREKLASRAWLSRCSRSFWQVAKASA